MLKFIAALLFAQVLLAAPLPWNEIGTAKDDPNDYKAPPKNDQEAHTLEIAKHVGVTVATHALEGPGDFIVSADEAGKWRKDRPNEELDNRPMGGMGSSK